MSTNIRKLIYSFKIESKTFLYLAIIHNITKKGKDPSNKFNNFSKFNSLLDTISDINVYINNPQKNNSIKYRNNLYFYSIPNIFDYYNFYKSILL